jgi:modification methylase
MKLNEIYCCDVLDGLKQLEDESIDLIITSPPYNKMGLNGKQKGVKWFGTIDYGNNINIDNKNEDDYQQWQIEILNECFRVLKKNGSMFYNHKNRIIKGKGTISNPYTWIEKSKFLIRQEIIWDRGSTNNVNRRRYLPTTEKIYWLTKTTNPTFDRKPNTIFKKEVWSFPFEKDTKHPAPFPIDLPNNIISCVKIDDKPITILDIFMGSGTVALSAIQNNCNYIGFELLQEYIDIANERIKNAVE